MDNNITYDLLITNGHIVDIANNMNQVSNIAILDGKISLINDEIGSIQYRRKIDAYGNIITAGLIDLHTHVAGGLRKIHTPSPSFSGQVYRDGGILSIRYPSST